MELGLSHRAGLCSSRGVASFPCARRIQTRGAVLTLAVPQQTGVGHAGSRRVLLPVSEQDTAIVKYVLETILEIDPSVRVARALDRAEVREIALAGKVRIVILMREDAEALLRSLSDFLECGKPTEEQHNTSKRLIHPLAAALRD